MIDTEPNYLRDYLRSFQDLYNYALSNNSHNELSERLSAITHGNLCRYSKDLIDNLITFKQRFEHGKQFILEDISYLQDLLHSDFIKESSTPQQIESINSLLLKLQTAYNEVCSFVEKQDF